jgi:hypothetical protein
MSGVYKFLNGREAPNVPGYRYRLGHWREVQGPLVVCRNGIHLLRSEHLSRWSARDLYRAEYDGELLEAGDKIVVRRARIVEHLKGWTERTARLAAVDFAEAVLPIFGAHYPDDDRPRKAIEAARGYVNGLIGRDALRAARAASAASADAARAAARAAADAAADAAAYAAASAAADAAYAAASAAAYAAADAADAAAYYASAASADAARAAAYAAADAAASASAADDDDAYYAYYPARAAAYAAQGEIILDYAYGRRG